MGWKQLIFVLLSRVGLGWGDPRSPTEVSQVSCGNSTIHGFEIVKDGRSLRLCHTCHASSGHGDCSTLVHFQPPQVDETMTFPCPTGFEPRPTVSLCEIWSHEFCERPNGTAQWDGKSVNVIDGKYQSECEPRPLLSFSSLGGKLIIPCAIVFVVLLGTIIYKLSRGLRHEKYSL